MSPDRAVDELYQAPLGEFVATRKRLAAALKTAGDKAGAARLAKLARPTQSAWAVNQLWWHARADFDALLATAARLRKGDLGATTAHREAIAKLRARAAALLVEGGHAAPESTLRKITTTLAALAAAGGFEPHAAGALATDLDPPGFEAAGIATVSTPPPPRLTLVKPAETRASAATAKHEAEAAAERERAEAAAERRKLEAARAKRTADRHRVQVALKTAAQDVDRREREVARLSTALADAETAAEAARAITRDLESQLASLEEP